MPLRLEIENLLTAWFRSVMFSTYGSSPKVSSTILISAILNSAYKIGRFYFNSQNKCKFYMAKTPIGLPNCMRIFVFNVPSSTNIKMLNTIIYCEAGVFIVLRIKNCISFPYVFAKHNMKVGNDFSCIKFL